jgi:pyridinium-3,5-bisthiocarboxylic acid mononucleotide nickel chelatase
MKTAYLDAFSGLSGDMIVGALLDSGADFAEFKRVLAALPLKGYRVATRRKMSSGISALKFDVEVLEPQPERHLGEIRAMIDASDMSPSVKRDANAIFAALAEAEAKIHHTSP